MKREEIYIKTIEYFLENRPIAETELVYSNPYELVVSVILSAQCTDKRVNQITPALFKKFPSANDMANSTKQDIYEIIKSCSYPNNKAKHLLGMARMLSNDFNNTLPSDINEQLIVELYSK